MFHTKWFLEFCNNDDVAVKIIEKVRIKRFNNALIMFLFEIFLVCHMNTQECISVYDACMLLLEKLAVFYWFVLCMYEFFRIFSLEFELKETDYINCMLLDNAKIEEFAVLRQDASCVYILDEYKKLKQISVCSPEEYECKEYIEIKRYSRLEDGLLKEIYEPI